ncbi:hypothetical protein [Microbacterium pumilum]
MLALSACSAAMDESARSPLPEGITAVLVQLRSDVAARQAQVEVHNAGDTSIRIGDVTVADPRLDGVASRVLDRESTLGPGGTVDFRIQLPEMACDVTEGTPSVRLTFVGQGADEVREGALPDALDVLGPMHERECRAQALAEAADVSIVSFTPSESGSPADLTLEIAPTGEDSARIVGVHDTNLLTFAGTQPVGYPIDIAVASGDTETTIVHLPLVPLRCDPHAVQEDKRGTVFTFDVEVEGEPGTVEIAAVEDVRGRILTWVANWCGFGPG